MFGFEKSTNFIISILIYSLIALLVLWAGFQTIEYAGLLKFYNRFVLQWEKSLDLYSARNLKPPVFTGSNHVDYMDTFVRRFSTVGITSPQSNTEKGYIYRVKRFWPEKDEDIFLLALENKIVFFGLSKTTFNMLDKKIDNVSDKKNGKFKGKREKNRTTYTGIWFL